MIHTFTSVIAYLNLFEKLCVFNVLFVTLVKRLSSRSKYMHKMLQH